MKAKAIVRLRFAKQQQQVILNSLKPEISRPASYRSRVSLSTKGEFLILEINAEDTTALRASLNSYLRWIHSILGVLEALKAHQ